MYTIDPILDSGDVSIPREMLEILNFLIERWVSK
jgi:hypothetical protein